MYTRSPVASISMVAQMIGSVLGRQVAMAIFRQTENGTDDAVQIIGTPSLTRVDRGRGGPSLTELSGRAPRRQRAQGHLIGGSSTRDVLIKPRTAPAGGVR